MSKSSPAKYDSLATANATLDAAEDRIEALERDNARMRAKWAETRRILPALEVSPMPGSKHRELRKSRHLSLTAAAVYAGVSEHTLRCYELDPNAVNDESRRKLDGYFAQLASTEARAG